MAGLNLDAELVDKRKSPISLEEALAKQTDPMKLVSGLQRYHEAVDAGEMPFTPEVGNMVKARLEALAGGVKRVGSAIADSFDPGPAPEDIGMRGSYRDPLNTATGGRMNPITAAGFTMLSAGEGMQGKPLSILDMQKTGVAREREIAQARAAEWSNNIHADNAKIAADREKRESVKQQWEYVGKLQTQLGDAKTDSPEQIQIYKEFVKAAGEAGHPPEFAAKVFRTIKENQKAVAEILTSKLGYTAAIHLSPNAQQELLKTVFGTEKGVRNAQWYTDKAIYDETKDPEVKAFFGGRLERLALSDKPPTAADTKKAEGEAEEAAVKGRVAIGTEAGTINKTNKEAVLIDERIALTRKEVLAKQVEIDKHLDEIEGTLKKDKRIASVFGQAMNMMLDPKKPVALNDLAEPYKSVVKKVLGNEDLRTTMAEIAIANLAVSQGSAQATAIQQAYKLLKDAEDSGDANRKRIAINMLDRAGFKATSTQDLLDKIFNLTPSAITVEGGGKAPPVKKPATPGKKKDTADDFIERFNEAFPTPQ